MFFACVVLDSVFFKKEKRHLLFPVVFYFLGLIGLVSFLKITQSGLIIEQAFGSEIQQTFFSSFKAASTYLLKLLDDRASVLLAEGLFILGGVELIRRFRKKQIVSLIPVTVLGVLFFSFCTLLFPATHLSFLELAAQIFYNQWDRLGEIFWFCHIILWSAGVLYFSEWLGKQGSQRRKIAASLFVFVIGFELIHSFTFVAKRLPIFYRSFQSATHKDYFPLVQEIKNHTPVDALIVAEPAAWDLLQSETNRRLLFGYGECPHSDLGKANCLQREAFYRKYKSRFFRGGVSTACFSDLVDFRPIYWVEKKDKKEMVLEKCTDVDLVWENQDWFMFHKKS
jgi:hypothetical protein